MSDLEARIEQMQKDLKFLRRELHRFVRWMKRQAVFRRETTANLLDLKSTIAQAAALHPQIGLYLTHWKMIGPDVAPEKWGHDERADALRCAKAIQKKWKLANGIPYTAERLQEFRMSQLRIVLAQVGFSNHLLPNHKAVTYQEMILKHQGTFNLEEWVQHEYRIA